MSKAGEGSSSSQQQEPVYGVVAATSARHPTTGEIIWTDDPIREDEDDFWLGMVDNELRSIEYDLGRQGKPSLPQELLMELRRLRPVVQWKCLTPPLMETKLFPDPIDTLRERIRNGGASDAEKNAYENLPSSPEGEPVPPPENIACSSSNFPVPTDAEEKDRALKRSRQG